MTKPAPQTGRKMFLGGLIGIACILIAVVNGGWRYINHVPPFHPHLPQMPQPNGYLKAAAALRRLAKTRRRPAPKHWPDGPPALLRARLAPIHSLLDEVRASFWQPWRQPPLLTSSLQGFETIIDTDDVGECARCFAAERILARGKGDYGSALERSLDAVELGSRYGSGSVIVFAEIGREFQAFGLQEAEQLVPILPASSIPAALARVRHIYSVSPRLAELLEAERMTTLDAWTDSFAKLAGQSLTEQLNSYHFQDAGPMGKLRLMLVPRRMVLADADRYYRQLIEESKKPFRHRALVPIPGNGWAKIMAPGLIPAEDCYWEETALTDYALLEVALAVRMHYLEHGTYPTRLSAISKKWLPAIPLGLWDQPIAYRLKDGRPVIYSLGPDGKDDGGQPTDPIDLTPTSRGDLVFGMLSHRRRRPQATGHRIPHH